MFEMLSHTTYITCACFLAAAAVSFVENKVIIIIIIYIILFIIQRMTLRGYTQFTKARLPICLSHIHDKDRNKKVS